MTQSGRPAQLGDADHGGQLGDRDRGINEGHTPLTPTYPPTPPRPAQLGDRRHGYQLGDPDHGANEGRPAPPIPAQFADDGVSLVLERQSGETYATETADREFGALSLDVALEANAVADWQATVPYAPMLERWGFATAHVGFGGERVFRGQLDAADTDVTGSAETQLSGLGPLGKMQRGTVSITFDTGETAFIDEAIERFLAVHAPPSLRFRVVTPTGRHRTRLPDAADGDREFEGSPLKILAELVGRAGMVWTVDHSRRDPLLEVFWPGLQRATPWRTLDIQRSLDLDGYNNHVIVKGALKGDGSGERYRGEAIDRWERQNIAAPPPEEIVQPDYTSDAECRDVAETELEKALGERTLSASAETTPALVSAPPGLYYRLEELEGEGITEEGPVFVPLTKTKYTESAGEAKTDLSFEAADELDELLRDVVRDGLDTGTLKRVDRRGSRNDGSGYGLNYGRDYGGQ